MIVDAALRRREAERDDTIRRSLETELVEVKRGIRNILAAIEQGIFSPSTKERLDELESRRAELELAIEDTQIEQPTVTREELTFWLERFRKGDPKDPKYRDTFIEVFISAVYVYDDHLRIVVNFTRDGGAISYDFVNEIETYEEAEVFDFDTRASTKAKILSHKWQDFRFVFLSFQFSLFILQFPDRIF